MTGDTLCEMCYGRLGYSAASHHLPSDMHQTIQEGTGRNNHSLSPQLHAPDSPHSLHGALRHPFHGALRVIRRVLHQQLLRLVLPDIKVRRFIQPAAPLPDKLPTVTLGTGTPHRRSFTTIQHPELDGCGIRHQTHLTAQRINLAHNLSFGNTTNGRVTRHLCDFVHVHGYQTGLSTHVSCRTGSLAPGMTTTDYQYIVVQNHLYLVSCLFNT